MSLYCLRNRSYIIDFWWYHPIYSFTHLLIKKNDYSIRSAIRCSDVPALLSIYAWYIENTSFSFELEVPSLADYQKRITQYAATAPWLVAEKDSIIVGYAYANAHRGRAAYSWNQEVSIYLFINYHGTGLAKNLYTTLFELLKLQGYANALAGIVQPNPKSIFFHQKMGFKLIGIYHNIGYKFNKWQDVGWYELFLQKPDFKPKMILRMEALLALPETQKILSC